MKLFYTFIVLILCTGVATSADVAGNQSGTWTLAESPYNLIDNVLVPAGLTLTIEPGVEVVYTGLYRIEVQGTLIAQGTVSDSIIFRHETSGMNHGSIDLVSGATASTLEFCRIQNGIADGSTEFGGGVDYHGGGIYLTSANHIIRNCYITNNNATYGGGMIVMGGSDAIVESNRIVGNSGNLGGGIGITNTGSNPTINNNLIYNNTASYGAGINFYADTEPVLFNNTIFNNTASTRGGGLNFFSNGNYVTATNTILWNNSAAEGNQVYVGTHTDSLILEYSDIEDGYSGTGNINADPLFTNPTNGDFHFEANSPVVDAGTNTGAPTIDFDGNTRPFDGDRLETAVVDMGAYEYINTAPSITSDPVLTVEEESSYSYQVTATDPDVGETLTFSFDTAPGFLDITSGGLITGDPDDAEVGQHSVIVEVSDLNGATGIQSFTLEVTPVNDPPVITAQGSLSTPEETELTIAFGDLTVTDPDDTYPADFTLSVQDGDDYTRNGNAITPVTDFNGDLTVPVTVNDGTDDSNTFDLTVSVTPENDVPVITDQVALSTPEETALTIVLANLTVTDPDDAYPADFTLSVQDGDNYTRNGNAITPATDFNGDLTVPVVVNDGSDNSAPFNLSVSVTPENDAPVIIGQVALSTLEETELTIVLANLTVTDPDNAYPADFTLIVQDGTNYTRSGNAITPVADFNGNLTVPVIVSDGTANSNTFNLTVGVTGDNDPPVITAQVALSTPEETALEIVLANLTVTDPDNAYPADFTLNVADGTNYTRSGNTITPAADFNGDLTVPVTVNDGTDNSNTFNLTVNVTPENDVPVITEQVTLSTAEETEITLALANLTVTDPDNTYPDDFTLGVGDGDNYTRTGNAITPVLDFNGELSVPVVVNDGTADSDTFNLAVTVTPENDAPVITAQVTLSTGEETALILVLANLTVTDPDNTYPDDFTLSVQDGDNYTRTDNTITPVADFNGDLTVPVTVNDGDLESNVFNVTVSVDAVNDPPIILAIPDTSFNEDDSLSIHLSALYDFVSDPETPDSALIFTILSGENVHAQIDSPYVVFKSIENWYGTDSVRVVVSDGEFSDTTDVGVIVKSVNDVPYFTDAVPDTIEFINVVGAVQDLSGWVDDVDLPEDNFSWEFEVSDEAVEAIFNAELEELTLNAPEFIGMAILRFTVSDDSSAEVTDSLVVKVTADPTSIADLGSQIPTSYELNQNYPNPFNPSTHIKYGLPKASRVTIVLYNVIGQKVQTLLEDHKTAGYHIFDFDASHLPSGVYFYRIQTEEFAQVKKMVLMK